MRAWAPRRAQATAWLAPLPPGAVKNVWPISVSPGAGRRGVRTTRSILMLPKITTLILCLLVTRVGTARLYQDLRAGTRLICAAVLALLSFSARRFRPAGRNLRAENIDRRVPCCRRLQLYGQ